MTKILVLENGPNIYDAPFVEFGQITHDIKHLADCDLVVFTGGHDVGPHIYGDNPHPTTASNANRDTREREVFTMAALLDIPMVGICRGAQFLNVMNGGFLIQNVNNHGIAGTHQIKTTSFGEVQVTSTHHQMMLPQRDYELLGWSENIATIFETGGVIDVHKHGSKLFVGDIFKEPDCVWWSSTSCLGVQYHPEYMNKDSGGWKYFNHLLRKYFFKFHKEV